MQLYRTRFGLRSLIFYTAFVAVVLAALPIIRQGEPIQVWISWLRTEDVANRRFAIDVLAREGPSARVASPALIATLINDRDPRVRADAAGAIVSVLRDETDASAKGDARAALIEATREGDATVRAAAATSLGMLGSGSPEAARALMAALKDGDERVREEAASALVRVGSAIKADREAILESLNAAMKDPSPRVRKVASSGRYRFMDEANRSSGVSSILRVRRVYPQSLLMKGEGAVPTLIGDLDDGDPSIREAAAVALGQMGVMGRSALPALGRAVRDRDPSVRRAATEARTAIGVGDAVK